MCIACRRRGPQSSLLHLGVVEGDPPRAVVEASHAVVDPVLPPLVVAVDAVPRTDGPAAVAAVAYSPVVDGLEAEVHAHAHERLADQGPYELVLAVCDELVA